MLKVALTGGIATGKSYVVAQLRERGVPCIEADDVVHEALASPTPTARQIAAEFGPAFLNADGSVNRARLGRMVFRDPKSRLRLEAIVHPIVYEAIHRWYEGLAAPFGVAAIPLLYETGREADFNYVVATVCSPEQQLVRLTQRDGMSEAEARDRLAAQMPPEEKVRRANFVIRTDDGKPETDDQVDRLLTALAVRHAMLHP